MKDGSILTVYSTYYEWDCSLQFPASYELMKPDGSVERGQLSAIAPDLEPVPSMDDIEAVDDIDTLDGLLTLTVLKWRYKRRVHDITSVERCQLPFWQGSGKSKMEMRPDVGCLPTSHRQMREPLAYIEVIEYKTVYGTAYLKDATMY